MKNLNDMFFYVLSCVVTGSEVEAGMFDGMDAGSWKSLYRLGKEQGVTALLFEKISRLPQEAAPSRELLMGWMSHSVSIEKQMGVKYAVAADFAQKLASSGIPVVVLKGVAVASLYPKPLQRECGDLDCYMMGKMVEGEDAACMIGAKVEESSYKHSHIKYKGLTIENHKYFTSFNNTERGKYTEKLLLELMNRKSPESIDGSALLNPNPDFNAFFLSKHALRHFIDEAISIRHILDWAFFMKAKAQDVDWKKLLPEMEKCRTKRFAEILTYISVSKLGLDIELPEGMTFSKETEYWAEKVLEDTFGGHPSMAGETFLQKCGRILRRFRRIWKFRVLADETPATLVWNAFAYSSYLHRKL